jgi:hypothetical protein
MISMIEIMLEIMPETMPEISMPEISNCRARINKT